MRDSIMDELKKQFRPEFLNRVDAVVVFQRLDHPQMRQIVDLMLAKVALHLAAQELTFTVVGRRQGEARRSKASTRSTAHARCGA